MQSHKLENRGTIVSGIAWEPAKLPQQRICGCGRPIARISKSDICQICVGHELQERMRRFNETQSRPGVRGRGVHHS